MDPRLVIMVIGYALGIALTVGLGFFVWIKAKRTALATIFLLMNLSIAVVEVSILLMALSTTAALAEFASFLNMANIFIVVFMAHWILEVIGKSRTRLVPLVLIYAGGIALFVYYLIDPSAFLFPSVPKLYLRNYFEPALWYTLMRVYFTVVAVYFLYELFAAYRKAADTIVRNRLRYVFTGIAFGMVTGHIALFLVYDIPVDPLFSMLFPLYTIPFAYAVIQYELMDIKIVARRAFFYALTVALLSALLGVVSFSNDLLVASYPSFPRIVVPLSVALLASALGFFVWLRLRDTETLKYEFITVVTHKFRTPLTQIKWTIENLEAGSGISPEVAEGLRAIAQADTTLVELTNTLIRTTESEEMNRAYDLRPLSLQELVQEALSPLQSRIAERRLRIQSVFAKEPVTVRADRVRLLLVLSTVLENAVIYTPQGGLVTVRVSEKEGTGEVTVTDSGIGISREDLPHVFEKFYRTSEAKRLMTEGVGIGLYIAKQITHRHGGTLSVSSEGPGKGTSFSLLLKAV